MRAFSPLNMKAKPTPSRPRAKVWPACMHFSAIRHDMPGSVLRACSETGVPVREDGWPVGPLDGSFIGPAMADGPFIGPAIAPSRQSACGVRLYKTGLEQRAEEVAGGSEIGFA